MVYGISEELPFDIITWGGGGGGGPYDRTKAEASLGVLQAVKEGLDAVIVCRRPSWAPVL